ncbi:hypothetical protein EDC04DRAFT_2890076 [Pisolithus marmoratus]|nr:hypothetical protein EDC04DRAFT_2890076 [Pisolithus marmoratus]
MQPRPPLTNGQLSETHISHELQRLGVATVNQIKQELGLGEKDNSALTFEDKQLIVTHAKFGAAVNRTPTLNPPIQPTSSMSELPASFLTTDFMQSVVASLDEFDPQGLFRSDEAAIDFEQFREWFNPPEDLDRMRND